MKRILGLMVCMICALALPASAQDASVTLRWDANTEGDLAGYKVHYGTATNIYNVVVDVGNKTTATISGLALGSTYFFVATAYDQSGNESKFSSEVFAQVTEPPVPNGPVLVDIGKAKLRWDAPTMGGTPDQYHVKCGDATGNYNHPQVDIAAPNTQIEIKLVVPTLGQYFCVVSAENQFGVSENSNEVNFTAGAVPGSPTNLKLS